MTVTFKVLARDGHARTGLLGTSAGDVETPVFMPVGTVGAVKNLTPAEVRAAGARIILANTYHLILRPGVDLVERAGGVGAFMGWQGPVLTDSGGFQVFSLGKIRKITEDGVLFNSHVDGTPVFLSPESVLDTQRRLRSTVAMPLDVCPRADADGKALEEALSLTTRWLDRTLEKRIDGGPALFGIFQGGTNLSLRRRHLEEVAARDVDGVAIGGLSVGEERRLTRETVAEMGPLMPADRPRYLMGMGKPEDLLHAVASGVDMFDCVFPTRGARHGLVFSFKGSYAIRQSRWKEDSGPLDETCPCDVCRTFDRRYLRHLFVCGETLAGRLLSQHNLTFYFTLIGRAREAVSCYKFEDFMRDTLEGMKEYGDKEDRKGATRP
jgi:queuine tRNA-ribosyltransferase